MAQAGAALALAGGAVAVFAPHPAAKIAGGAVALIGTLIAYEASQEQAREDISKAEEKSPEITISPIVITGDPARGGDNSTVIDVSPVVIEVTSPEGTKTITVPPIVISDGDGDEGEESQGSEEPGGGEENGCFVEGTPVLTAHGSVPIENVNTSDKIHTYDFDEKTTALGAVRQTHVSVKSEVLVIEMDGDSISCTPRHRFYLDRWTPACELKIGDRLLCMDGNRVQVTAIRQALGSRRVYNIGVEGAHNYFVGRYGILVHNLKKEDGQGAEPDSDGW
jgi:hypothetical protein